MTERRRSNGQLVAMMFGSSLAAGGFLHFWRHAHSGVHDWAPVVIIVLGAGIAFNEQVAKLTAAWKGRRDG